MARREQQTAHRVAAAGLLVVDGLRIQLFDGG